MVIPPDSALYASFARLLERADLVFFAGLPGVGKSLLLQQMALMAAAAGRSLTLLQWDVARHPFETPRYPLVDGATHPLVIRAVGHWSRGAIVKWADARAENDLLLGEAPLIGGRFMQLVRPADDAAEALLSDERARFLLPVPSVELRAHIESQRRRSIAAPRHDNEAHDAPPDLLRALWRDLHHVALQLGLADTAEDIDPAYSPEIYAAVYRQLLRHRHIEQVDLRRPLPAATSVYDGLDALPQLRANPAEAAAIMAKLEAAPPGAEQAWYDVQTV